MAEDQNRKIDPPQSAPVVHEPEAPPPEKRDGTKVSADAHEAGVAAVERALSAPV